MTVLEKIKRCVSLVWNFQEIYGEEDIEDFCDKELSTYTQHNEIVEYFKHLAELEKENADLKESNKMLEQGYVWHDYDAGEDCYEDTHKGKWVKRDEVYCLTKAKELLKDISSSYGSTEVSEAQLYLKIKKAEIFLKDSEVEK